MHRDRRKVYESYDKIADWFDEVRSRDLIERPYLEALTANLEDGAGILDLGCGTGEPVLRFLSEFNYQITGVDGSRAMLDKAKSRFPNMKFILEDMRDIDLAGCFDAIIAWHSLFHLPPDDQRDIFEVLTRHMNPGGLLLFTSGTTAGECWSNNGGEDLYQSSLDTEEYKHLLAAQNFHVLRYVEDDPECGRATIWLARYQPEAREGI